jgi:hypothetical protein
MEAELQPVRRGGERGRNHRCSPLASLAWLCHLLLQLDGRQRVMACWDVLPG